MKTNEKLYGLIRHILTVVGGVLIKEGVTDQETVEIASGAILSLIVVVWSWLSKNRK